MASHVHRMYVVLQHTATHCNPLQHTATHCNTLQHTARHCNTLQDTARHCKTLQDTARHCNTLQDTARHCNTLQHTCTSYVHRMYIACISHVYRMYIASLPSYQKNTHTRTRGPVHYITCQSHVGTHTNASALKYTYMQEPLNTVFKGSSMSVG